MKTKQALAGVLLWILGSGFWAWAVQPTPHEFERRAAWLKAHVTEPNAMSSVTLPCSFRHDQKPLSDTPAAQIRQYVTRISSPGKVVHTVIQKDLLSRVTIRFEVTEFADHPALEWVVYLENQSFQDSPLLQDIRALDTSMFTGTNWATLHYARGAVCSFDDFQPITEILKPDTKLQLNAGGGRSSSDFLPFFNLEQATNGLIIGLGWSGEWAAEFRAEQPDWLQITAGQALTRLRLHPGETIRTPRVALLFYEGNWLRGQNLWRRFVLDQHRPMVNGKLIEPPLFNGNWGGTHADHHLANIRILERENLPVDYYWIDAEWFGEGPWYVNPGNWQPKKQLYPSGFRPLSDALHQSGRKLLLWFEPERVCEGTTWDREHSRWLLKIPPERRVYRWDKQTFPDWVKSESLRNQIKENDRLFNLADPQAREFLTDFISDRITEWGLDCYRHDANIAPLEFWREADASERQGLTEIRWVEGLYAFWDELLRRHPHLLIDNCASGGRRIDLETMSRSVPLWRTDFPGDPVAKQCHTYGLSFWAPLNGTGGVYPGRDSRYALRSSMSSTLAFGLFGQGDAPQAGPPSPDFPLDQAKAALDQCRSMQPYYLGDYYPLTPYSKAKDVWIAWQFDLPDKGKGMVQAFRRDQCPYESARFSLLGLDPAAQYRIVNLDSGETTVVAGHLLLEKGLAVAINQPAGDALIKYSKID